MKKRTTLGLILTYFTLGLAAIASAQAVSVLDTVYVPPGYSDGPGMATVVVPVIGNGIGVILVHGAGGNRQMYRSYCDILASFGYTAMSIDYPDPLVRPMKPYPQKTRAVKLAVEFLRRSATRFGITTGKIVGWGFSMGAATWGEAIIWDNDDEYFQTDSTIDDHVDAAVLYYGYYENYFDEGIFWDLYFENDPLKVAKATCVQHIGNITTPVLLVHGTADDVVPYRMSVQLHDSLIARGKVSQLLPFPGLPHVFDMSQSGNITPAGLVAKDSALAFLRRTVAPQLRIHVNTPFITFGNALLKEAKITMASIGNIGSGPLMVDSIVNANPQVTLLDLPSFPATVPAGGSLNFKAALDPSIEGVMLDTIRILTDDPLHPTVSITLQARAIPSPSPASAGVLYVTSFGVPVGQFHTMNVGTGDLSTIGPLGTLGMQSMAIRHSDHTIFGSYTSPTTTHVYWISSSTGRAEEACVLPVGELRAIVFSPDDTLYGVTATGSLYRLDVITGQADSIGTSPGLVYSGLAFRPGRHELWASVRTPRDNIYTINTTTGAATLIGTTGLDALTNSLAFDSRGNLFALIDSSGVGFLAVIDTAKASGSIVAGPLSKGGLQALAMGTDTPGTIAEEQIGGNTPVRFALEQNYPNPFNPTTTIRYATPVRARVRLSVFNSLGQEVAVLVNGEVGPGNHEARLDGRGLPSGVYFYRLQAGSYRNTKKFVLLK